MATTATVANLLLSGNAIPHHVQYLSLEAKLAGIDCQPKSVNITKDHSAGLDFSPLYRCLHVFQELVKS